MNNRHFFMIIITVWILWLLFLCITHEKNNDVNKIKLETPSPISTSTSTSKGQGKLDISLVYKSSVNDIFQWLLKNGAVTYKDLIDGNYYVLQPDGTVKIALDLDYNLYMRIDASKYQKDLALRKNISYFSFWWPRTQWIKLESLTRRMHADKAMFEVSVKGNDVSFVLSSLYLNGGKMKFIPITL